MLPDRGDMPDEFTFYLGTHKPQWLRMVGPPLFVSWRTLRQYKSLPRAACRWAMDSGAFSEIAAHGQWTVGAHEYARSVRRIMTETGRMDWAVIQDWMCEPRVLLKTGKSVREHQELTVQNYADLLTAESSVPWVPVLQGWALDDYLRCADMYDSAGLDLSAAPAVGIGSVCRRQGTRDGQRLIRRVSEATGLRLHGFGLKTAGLPGLAGRFLSSADSMAWSFSGRMRSRERENRRCLGCEVSCSNCRTYALAWRRRVIDRIGGVV